MTRFNPVVDDDFTSCRDSLSNYDSNRCMFPITTCIANNGGHDWWDEEGTGVETFDLKDQIFKWTNNIIAHTNIDLRKERE